MAFWLLFTWDVSLSSVLTSRSFLDPENLSRINAHDGWYHHFSYCNNIKNKIKHRVGKLKKGGLWCSGLYHLLLCTSLWLPANIPVRHQQISGPNNWVPAMQVGNPNWALISWLQLHLAHIVAGSWIVYLCVCIFQIKK